MTFEKVFLTGGLAVAITLISSCSDESDPIADEQRFTRIYDSNQFNASYDPIDIVQTTDGGYLVLGTRRLDNSNFRGIYILRTNADGGFVSGSEPEVDLVNPIGPILTLGGKLYFFAMTPVGLQSQLVELGEDGTIGSVVDAGGSYPAAAAFAGDNILLLNYDIDNKATVISLISPDGNVNKSASFSIGAGDAVEEPIINHFLRTGRHFPFQVGVTSSGLYFFNGFYNYTFSLVFTDLSSNEPIGVVQGQQDDSGLNGMLEISQGKYAVSRFSFGDQYLLPSTVLQSTGISSSVDLGGYQLPELLPDTRVAMHKVTLNGRDVLIFGADTRGKQIGLFGYNPNDGTLLGTRYIGFSNSYSIADIVSTDDGGVAICGTTFLAGRFPRICIFKLSATDLSRSF